MTALQEQAIQLIERMPDERLPRALDLLRGVEAPSEDVEPLARSRPDLSIPLEDDRRRKLIALFGSITDETFRQHPDLPLSLDAERDEL